MCPCRLQPLHGSKCSLRFMLQASGASLISLQRKVFAGRNAKAHLGHTKGGVMWSCHMFQQNCMDDTPPLAWGGSLNPGLYTILRTTPSTLFPTLHLHDLGILRRASECSLVVSICLVDPLVCQIGFLIRPARRAAVFGRQGFP